jgi:Kef-type K+ transport system membrane component KefB
VTAFPVLARILTDRNMHRSKLGVIALSCAAVDDVSAWCLLAAIVGLVHARGASALVTLGLTLAYVSFMVFVVRKGLEGWLRRSALRGGLPEWAGAAVLIGLLVSALITESIGIHALFGAFLLGAIIPHDSTLARDTARKLEDLVVVVLLPAFFAFTGMRTRLSLLESAADIGYCALIIFVACAGKIGGTMLAARLTGLGLREAAALGALMNTRGLMELIVLNVGLDLGVISPRLFAMLVVMAVVTTLATAPLLSLLRDGSSVNGAVSTR